MTNWLPVVGLVASYLTLMIWGNLSSCAGAHDAQEKAANATAMPTHPPQPRGTRDRPLADGDGFAELYFPMSSLRSRAAHARFGSARTHLTKISKSIAGTP